MEHVQFVNAAALESYASMSESERYFPALIHWLILESLRSDVSLCRIPYGDSVNQPGWDGLLQTTNGYKQYVPTGDSFWEFGTGANPQKKATAEFKKRTRESGRSKASSAFVFATPRSAGTGGWPQPAQQKWLKTRKKSGWREVKLLDGDQIADWLKEFPAIGRWLAARIGMTASGTVVTSPSEHWDNLKQLGSGQNPSMPPSTFLIGRESATNALLKLFEGKEELLLVGVEAEEDAEDFVAAFLASLPPMLALAYSGKCLYIKDERAWESYANLKVPHVLVASPDLRLDESTQLQMRATKNKHAIVLPISRDFTHQDTSAVQLRSPSRHALEKVFTDGGFSSSRSAELANIEALSLARLKRFMRGLGNLPPYATWPNARTLAQAMLVGQWDGENPRDREIVELVTGKPYGEWIVSARAEALRTGTPLTQRNEKWRVQFREEAWVALGPQLANGDLDNFLAAATNVLSAIEARFEVPLEERALLVLANNNPEYTSQLKEGISETLALLGSRASALSACGVGKAETTAVLTVRKVLKDAPWQMWATLSYQLPLLAEAAPIEFLTAIEESLLGADAVPLKELFAQEASPGTFNGGNPISGVLWAMESLAWNERYFQSVIANLGEMAAHDPGGQWSNRPVNSIIDILLPWVAQTTAKLSMRVIAMRRLLEDVPDVGWRVLLALLPNAHLTTSGTHQPKWQQWVPENWERNVLQSDYWDAVSAYADLAVEVAAANTKKLAELIDRLPDLTIVAFDKLLAHLNSELVTSLDEQERAPLWESLVDLAAKHRSFAKTAWAMPAELVDRIESTARSLAPQSPQLVHRRLFSDSDFDLYEDREDFDAQQELLNAKREAAAMEILSALGVDGLLKYRGQVQSTSKLGFALGRAATLSNDNEIVTKLLSSANRKEEAFVEGYLRGKLETKGWPWVDTVLKSIKGYNNRLALLLRLPFDIETWLRVDANLRKKADWYWKDVAVYGWGLKDAELVTAVQRLLKVNRPHDALNCLHPLAHRKTNFPASLAVKALLGALTVTPHQQSRHYDVQEVIEWLQKQLPSDSEDLFRVEWAYMPILDRRGAGVEPIALANRIASVPEFFHELISLVFRSEKQIEDSAEDSSVPERDEQTRAIATNAYRLLHSWRRVPGTQSDGSFDADKYESWLSRVKSLATESGHRAIALSQLGENLVFSPADSDGFWINRKIAKSLNAADASNMRSGFRTGSFNKRGVYSPSGGQKELELADYYNDLATKLDGEGFARFAATIREVADGYTRQADRDANSES